MDGGDEADYGSKRQRLMDSNSSYYGNSPGPSFAYGNAPYMSQFFGQPGPFPVVRLRGLPYDCTELDIGEFFHGLDIVDVLFVHKNGRFSGEAFCVLAYPVQVDFALQRNRQNMGRRYIEVFRGKRQEYYQAVANEVGGSRRTSPRPPPRVRSYDETKDSVQHTGVLKLRGLPFSAAKEDILEFFKDFDISDDNVHIVYNLEGRMTGEAFVEFASEEDSKAARIKDRKTIGSRYIELFPLSRDEVEDATSKGR